MSVDLELAKAAAKVEYILCIEGVGWPTDEASISSGFDGTVFVTNDINGDLASVLGCSIHHGLELPSSISDTFDPRTYDYKAGDLSFAVLESEADFLETTFRPHIIDVTDTLSAQLDWEDSTITLTDGAASWSNADVAWVAGREACLLSNKVGATFDAQRGYLGTPKGKRNARATGQDAFAWMSGTKVYSGCRFWYNRRVALFVHVPGETVGNCIRMYNGRLRNFTLGDQGTKWKFNTVAMDMVAATRMRETPTAWVLGAYNYIQTTEYESSYVDTDGPVGYESTRPHNAPQIGYADHFNIHLTLALSPYAETADLDAWEKNALTAFYNYRSVAGGTAGVSGFTPTAPQTYQGSGGDENRIDAVMRIGNTYMRILQKMPDLGFNHLMAEPWDVNRDLSQGMPQWGGAEPVRFLLDNEQDSWERSRFAFNKNVSRNVVDVFLMFATSMNNEFFIGDRTAGDADSITLGAPGWTVNEWAGYAMHVVEGTRKGEARTITSNTATTLELDRALSGAPGADECQIRNSIYDVLPLGWGMGIHNSMIDIDAFEQIRDKYLSNAEVGVFCIGDSDSMDIWDLLVENLCKPYGFIPYIDRGTGKLSCVYIGESMPDGIVDDYTAVTTEDIIDIGDIEYSSHVPLAQIELRVRDIGRGPINFIGWAGPADSPQALYSIGQIRSMSLGGKDHLVRIVPEDIDAVFDPSVLDAMQFTAMFNSVEDDGWVANEMANRVRRHAVPLPTVQIKLAGKFTAGTNVIHIGSLLTITDTDKFDPIDPFGGGRGWTNMLARVIEAKIVLSDSGPMMDCRVQLLNAINGAKIAPACNVTAKGNDAGGDYFTINATDFVMDEEIDRDDDEFGVDDRIELRDINGAWKESEVIKTIDTANNRIYVDGAIASAIAAGDYITFSDWTAFNTANMDDFAALADASETIGADEGKEWG